VLPHAGGTTRELSLLVRARFTSETRPVLICWLVGLAIRRRPSLVGAPILVLMDLKEPSHRPERSSRKFNRKNRGWPLLPATPSEDRAPPQSAGLR
jgi:hypothetical protein